MKTFWRATAWLIAFAIVLLSLVPAELRPVTAAQNVEHASIFLLLGATAGFAYPGGRGARFGLMFVFAGIVEAMQLFAPGRHARWEDFIVDAAAGAVGLIIAQASRAWLRSNGTPERQN